MVYLIKGIWINLEICQRNAILVVQRCLEMDAFKSKYCTCDTILCKYTYLEIILNQVIYLIDKVVE